MLVCQKYAQKQESGQAMTEYMVLIMVVAIVCAFLWRTLPEAVVAYMQAFFYCISRPFP